MTDRAGLRLGSAGWGKHEFRLRESHIADHLIPLMRRRAVGAAKLDVVLRCVALLPDHARKNPAGTVLRGFTYERLHDLSRPRNAFGDYGSEVDTPAEVVAAKRKWVGEQLQRLEAMDLVQREDRAGRRPRLIVLRDDGSGEPFDDPDGSEGNSYVRILGSLVARRTLARWGAPQLSAYLAAMTAERYTDAARGITRKQPGRGKWFRQLDWFADPDGSYGPESRVRLGFSVATLERGMIALEKEGLLDRERTTTDPFRNRRLAGPRVVYTNRFASAEDLDAVVEEEAWVAELDDDDDEDDD